MVTSAIRNPKAALASLHLSVKGQVYLLAAILAAFYAVEVIDLILRTFTHFTLDSLGVRPRTLWGLLGIPLAPFLHGGFVHLFANSFPFFVLGWLVLLSGRTPFFHASAIIVLAGGLGVWTFGSGGSNHIGASGLIYGYLGFILVRAYVERKIVWIVIAVATGILYSGLLFGLVNIFKEGTSWAGHFYGLAAGALAALILNRRTNRRRIPPQPSSNPTPKHMASSPDDVDALLEELRRSRPNKK